MSRKMFDVGDVVICVDDDGAYGYLDEGKRYTVIEVIEDALASAPSLKEYGNGQDSCLVVDDGSEWLKERTWDFARFRLASQRNFKAGDKVVCVSLDDVGDTIKKGNTYTVSYINGDYLYFAETGDTGHFVRCFVLSTDIPKSQASLKKHIRAGKPWYLDNECSLVKTKSGFRLSSNECSIHFNIDNAKALRYWLNAFLNNKKQ